MPTPRTGWLVIALAASLVGPTSAWAQHGLYNDGLPPELQRLLRQAHDYAHNSNRNVFRSSRHFSPDRNPFRSSRHYQQKLAAAHEARPVRTFVRFGERVDGGPRRVREFSFAHHLGRYYRWPVRTRGALLGEQLHDPATSVLLDPATKTVGVTPAHSRPTQQAAIKRVRLPDGRVRTIIYSVPVDEVADASAGD